MIIRDVSAAGGPTTLFTDLSLSPSPTSTSIPETTFEATETAVVAAAAAATTSRIPGIPDPDRTRPGVIVGAVVGSVLGALLLIFVLLWWKGKGFIDRRKPPAASPEDPPAQGGDQPYTHPTASRVSFATARTDRSGAPSAVTPGETEKPRRGSESPTKEAGLEVPEIPGRSPSRASHASHGSKVSVSKLSGRLSKTSLRLSVRNSSSNLNPKKASGHYTTTTERLRDRPFSTIYDADSVGWDKDVANITDLADLDGDLLPPNSPQHRREASSVGSSSVDGVRYSSFGRDEDDNPMNVRNTSPIRRRPDLEIDTAMLEVPVQDPALRESDSSSGTPSPTNTLGVGERERRLSARERMLALYSQSHTNLRTSEERARYTLAHERE